MKIRIEVCEEGSEGRAWNEEYVTDEPAEEYARKMIQKFNSTLRPNEKPRNLLSVEVLDENVGMHVWEKTSLVGKNRNGLTYDTYRCKKCGITGKRYGLNDGVIIDPKYKAKKIKDVRSEMTPDLVGLFVVLALVLVAYCVERFIVNVGAETTKE